MVCPQRPIYQICAAIFLARVHFISGNKTFVDICPSNTADRFHESRRGAKKSFKKKNSNIFPNDRSPFRSEAVINIEQPYHWLITPRSECRHGQTRLPQQELAWLRHASPFNIVLKQNWLHLNRHGSKSHQHLAEVGFYRWWGNRHPRRASSPHLRFGLALLRDDGATAPSEPTDWRAGFMAV